MVGMSRPIVVVVVYLDALNLQVLISRPGRCIFASSASTWARESIEWPSLETTNKARPIKLALVRICWHHDEQLNFAQRCW